TWTNLRYDTFNSGMGSYTDGGSDCYRTNSYSSEGGYSVCILDNNGVSSSFYLTNSIDLHTPEYKSLMVDFWWMWNDNGWSTGEDWWLQYYNGYSWETILDTNYPSGYAKDVWHHTIVYINETEHTYPTNMRLRFMCDASYDNDRVYFDQIYINASSYGRIECDFDRLPSTALTPRTGSYSLGGSGDFDPEYAAFNRTSIDLSLYTDVELSVWYSYKDTEAADFFGLYYYNLTHWTPIFEIHTPQSAGQFPWTEATVSIPDEIDDLIIQFKWMTSSTTEYVAIDDLVITGLPQAGENNFTGLIDEVKIYPRVLSIEQLYQNYLCTQDSTSARNVSVIVAEETVEGETWQCFVTPNDGVYDYAIKDSNTIEIGGGG
ncbi:MAG: hypothetical protein JXA00_02115, partial [Candidatus Thermoplasmatota archaeon]|nr:hypothetical protein [Candidatus Thermoplasmatota archaeon]